MERAQVPESVSKVMRANKEKDTGPELMMRKALRDVGLRGYRKHWKVAGRPDIAYVGRKVAIFVNGCFWHRCPTCDLPLPKTNVEFWKAKFSRNMARDARNKRKLEESGWKVFVVWECEIKRNPVGCALRVKEEM